MSKTLRFLALVLAQMPSCFSILSEAKFRPHREHAIRPSLPPADGPVAKIDLRGIVAFLVGDDSTTGLGANFGFTGVGVALVSCVALVEDFCHLNDRQDEKSNFSNQYRVKINKWETETKTK